MADLNAAIDYFEREMVKAEGLPNAVEALRGLRAADGMTQAMESRAHNAKVEAERAELAVTESRDKAAQILATANEEADDIRAKAKREADDTKAKAAAAAEKTAGQALVAQAKAEEGARAAAARMASLEVISENLQKEIADLTDKLNTLKEAAAKLLA